MSGFPAFVYRCPGPHSCLGGSFEFVAVSSHHELQLKLAEGYFSSLPEAMEGKRIIEPQKPIEPPIDARDDLAPPTRSEMELKAKELKISFNEKTSDKKLLKMISDALRK